MTPVDEDRRDELEPFLAGLETKTPEELNYVLNELCFAYLKRAGLSPESWKDACWASESSSQVLRSIGRLL